MLDMEHQLNKLIFAYDFATYGFSFFLIALVLVNVIKILFKKDINYKNFYLHSFIAGGILGIVILYLK